MEVEVCFFFFFFVDLGKKVQTVQVTAGRHKLQVKVVSRWHKGKAHLKWTTDSPCSPSPPFSLWHLKGIKVQLRSGESPVHCHYGLICSLPMTLSFWLQPTVMWCRAVPRLSVMCINTSRSKVLVWVIRNVDVGCWILLVLGKEAPCVPSFVGVLHRLIQDMVALSAGLGAPGIPLGRVDGCWGNGISLLTLLLLLQEIGLKGCTIGNYIIVYAVHHASSL